MSQSESGADDVGSLGEEATKLIGALSGWARELNGHLATNLATGEDCAYCPVCRGVQFVRSTSPEVRAQLVTASSSLLQVAASLLASQAASSKEGGADARVEHIDLDEGDENVADWPEPEEEPS